MSCESTLAIVKPSGVARGLVGTILTRYENAGLAIRGLWFGRLTEEQWKGFYGDLGQRIPAIAYEEHIAFMCSGPCAFVTMRGPKAVDRVRQINGNTRHAFPGTIRGDYATVLPDTVVHASDTSESFERELRFLHEEAGLRLVLMG
jgi:nucleoside-diphosphate kinase